MGTVANPVVKIGIAGGLRAGKDTVAEMLQKLISTHYTNDSTMILGFSDGITGLLEDYVPDVFNGGKPRKAYQVVGQTMRQFDKDVWVKKLLETIEVNEMVFPNTHYIIRDIRQPNEAETLRKLGFTIIKVVADRDERIERASDNNDNFTLEDLQHETELAVDEIVPDIVVENSGTLDELKDILEDILLSYQAGDLE